MTPIAVGAKGLFVQFECREFVALEQLRDIGAAVKVAKPGVRSDSCRYAVVGVIPRFLSTVVLVTPITTSILT